MQKTRSTPSFLSKLKPHPSEVFVLSLAAFFILAAKFQDYVLEENSQAARQPVARQSGVLNEPPSGRGRSRPVAEPISEVSDVYPDTAVGSISENFDADFSEVAAPPTPAATTSSLGIRRTAELAKFLRKFRHTEQLKNQRLQLEGAAWESLAKNASVNFGYVEQVFGDAAPREALRDVRRSAEIFKNLENRFGIPAAELARFAQDREAEELAEWAFFIENRL